MSGAVRKTERVGPGGSFKKVMSVTVEPGHRLLLTFEGGELRRFDFKAAILDRGPTEFTSPLAVSEVFAKVSIERGNLVWPNGFDLHGDDVYKASVPVH